MKIKTIAAGYSHVTLDSGRKVGHLQRSKNHSSTRTGTMWEAHSMLTGFLGVEDTRVAAARLIEKQRASKGLEV